MDKFDRLNLKKYNDLQKMAKSLGLKANLKHQKLIEAIIGFKEKQISFKVKEDSSSSTYVKSIVEKVSPILDAFKGKSKKSAYLKSSKQNDFDIASDSQKAKCVDAIHSEIDSVNITGKDVSMPDMKNITPVVKRTKGRNKIKKTALEEEGSDKKIKHIIMNDSDKNNDQTIDLISNTMLNNPTYIKEKRVSLPVIQIKEGKLSGSNKDEIRKKSLKDDINVEPKDILIENKSQRNRSNEQTKDILKNEVNTRKKGSMKMEGKKASRTIDSNVGINSAQSENDLVVRKSSKYIKTGDEVLDDYCNVINQAKKRQSPRNLKEPMKPNVAIQLNKRKRSSIEKVTELKKSRLDTKDDVSKILKDRNIKDINSKKKKVPTATLC